MITRRSLVLGGMAVPIAQSALGQPATATGVGPRQQLGVQLPARSLYRREQRSGLELDLAQSALCPELYRLPVEPDRERDLGHAIRPCHGKIATVAMSRSAAAYPGL